MGTKRGEVYRSIMEIEERFFPKTHKLNVLTKQKEGKRVGGTGLVKELLEKYRD